MALIECEDCKNPISDQAPHCIHCGRPIQETEIKKAEVKAPDAMWSVTRQIKTPINVFALAMMTCAAVLGASATTVETQYELTAFTYTLHIFLAICGMFFATLLFAKGSIYHPEEIAKAQQNGFNLAGKDNP